MVVIFSVHVWSSTTAGDTVWVEFRHQALLQHRHRQVHFIPIRRLRRQLQQLPQRPAVSQFLLQQL